ncbi:ninein-like protein [Liolophura sinensis]|uniref:ninein-like protein n=1 Tax=Liolophura sinensis TaxID=3198878 RepID=UPI0031581B82
MDLCTDTREVEVLSHPGMEETIQQYTEDDPYVAQLQEVFNSCDVSGSGFLGEAELQGLCCKLHLENDSESLIRHLLHGDSLAKVDFRAFKERIVQYLCETMTDWCPVVQNDSLQETDYTSINGRKQYKLALPRHRTTTLTVENSWKIPADNTVRSEHSEDNEDRHGLTDCIVQLKDQETFEADGELEIRMGDVPHLEPEDEPLREIWRHLNLHIDQDLTMADLKLICDHIGLDMHQEELEDLFSRLDTDGDGRIAFAEVHEGLFQHGLSSGQTDETFSQDPPSLPQSSSPKRLSSLPGRLSGLDDSLRSQPSSLRGTPCGIFSALDTEKTGQCFANELLEYWESLGVSHGEEILMDLGFDPHSTSKISLGELSFLLTQEMAGLSNQSGKFQAAFLSYQQEFSHYRILLEQLTAERKKLKKDLVDANNRNDLLVKEADERHLKIDQTTKSQVLHIEQKYQAEVKALQSIIDEERDAHSRQLEKVQDQMEKKIETLKQKEESLKEDLGAAQREIEKLERDIGELMEQLDESETANERLRRDLQSLSEGQSPDDVPGFSPATLQQLQQENKGLKDKCDELMTEVERLRQELKTARRASASLVGSERASPSSKRRRQVSIEYLTNEEAMDEDDDSSFLPSATKEPDSHLLELVKELEQLKNNFELERRDIEEAFKMEIVEIEERHDKDRKQLLSSFAQEKEKMKEELTSAHQEKLAELERSLQNEFATVKQDMILRHESEKNYIRVKNEEEKEEMAKGMQADREMKETQVAVMASDKGRRRSSVSQFAEDLGREKAVLLDRFLKEKRELEEAHSQEKAALFQEVEAERKELVQKYEKQIAGLEAEIKSVRERLEAARDALLESKARGQEATRDLTQQEGELRERLGKELQEQLTPEIRKQLTPEIRKQLTPEIRKQLTPEIWKQLTPEIRKQLTPEIQNQLTSELREKIRQEVKEESEENFVSQILKMQTEFDEQRHLMETKQRQTEEDLAKVRQVERELREINETLRQSNTQLMTDLARFKDNLENEKTKLRREQTEYNRENIELERVRKELDRVKRTLEQERADVAKRERTLHEQKRAEHTLYEDKVDEYQKNMEQLIADRDRALQSKARGEELLTAEKHGYQKLLEDKQSLESQLRSCMEELSRGQT